MGVMEELKNTGAFNSSTLWREPDEFTQSLWVLQSLSKEHPLHVGAPQSLDVALLTVIKCSLAKWFCSVCM